MALHNSPSWLWKGDLSRGCLMVIRDGDRMGQLISQPTPTPGVGSGSGLTSAAPCPSSCSFPRAGSSPADSASLCVAALSRGLWSPEGGVWSFLYLLSGHHLLAGPNLWLQCHTPPEAHNPCRASLGPGLVLTLTLPSLVCGPVSEGPHLPTACLILTLWMTICGQHHVCI
jgi:hypothetical protein